MSKKTKEISREKYRSILSGVELEELFLEDGKFYLKLENFSPESNIKIKDNATLESVSKEKVDILHSYTLIVIDKKSRKYCLKIEGNFKVVFSCKKEFTQDFFEAFKRINLPINTWPYFREYVNNITSRMNIPPLTIPLLRFE